MAWLLDKIFGVDQLTADGAASDAKLAALNQAALDRGAITQAEYDQSSANLAKSDSSAYSGQMADAFGEGWKDGYNAETNGIKSALNSVAGGVTGFVWKSIPWWIWLGAALFGLWYFGILQRLFKR